MTGDWQRVATDMDRVTIFAGRFGSGKSEAAINYALARAAGLRLKGGAWTPGPPCSDHLTLIDLDIVTPFFRSREMAQAMANRGVHVIGPAAVGQHLDIPAISPEILGAIQQVDREVIVDAGGDPQGARALGQFSGAIRQREHVMHFVVNPYRPFTGSVEGVARSIAEIEGTSRLQVTSLVSNPNLIGETTESVILDGHARVVEFAQAIGLPIAFVCVERRWSDALPAYRLSEPVLVLDRHFVMSWE